MLAKEQKKIIETNPPADCIKRWPGESFQEYFIRLYENKNQYKITCQKIAELLNTENGKSYGESAYRKQYTYFNRGRIYEREHNFQYVGQRVLTISDLHVPYQLSVDVFKPYQNNIDILVLNGDIMDCQGISKFPKQYRYNFVEEMIDARQYVIDLIDMLQPNKVYITKGNHEHRLVRYLSSKLNEDLLNIMPDSPMDLIINDGFKNNDRLNKIEIYYSPLKEIYAGKIDIIYEKNWYCRVGNVIFAHPLTYSSPIMKTSEKAVSYFSILSDCRDFTALVMAHTHRVGFYKIGDVLMYEQGCCCKLDMLDYTDGMLTRPQQNGFIYISLDNNGNIIEDKTKLITDI